MGFFSRLFRKSSLSKDKPTPLVPPPPKLEGLILYTMAACPYCKVVCRAIDQLDVEVELRDTRKNREWRNDLRRRTGRTQVPCLFIEGEPMFESKDIVAWLNGQYQ